jgi:hypothetical protein
MTHLLLLTLLAVPAPQPPLRLAPFRVDVTPPLGDGPCVGCMPFVSSVEHPLELRGVILRTSDDRTFVLAAIDYCGLCNTSDEHVRTAMARAAGTTVDRVALQSLHQHSAPILDAEAARLLHGESSPPFQKHQQFTHTIAHRTASAITAALEHLSPITRITATRAKVDRVAANRRVPQADGTIAVRASLTKDLAVRNAPEGLIDPWLRTLTFFAGDKPLAELHYYATHPQTFYGDGRVSWDMVGIAREKRHRIAGSFVVYFTGCGGNVTVGKYNDGTRAAREQLANRFLAAMNESATSTPLLTVDLTTPQEIHWDTAPLRFTPREQGTFDPALLRSQLAPDQPFSTRLTAAMFSGFTQRLRDGHVPQASRLRIGLVDILHLPGEPFVEFQLAAQDQARPESFTCVAGYGECGVWYYGPDTIFSDRGGYEQTWSVTGPCQTTVESALKTLLAPTP